jgi:hypothetical protein
MRTVPKSNCLIVLSVQGCSKPTRTADSEGRYSGMSIRSANTGLLKTTTRLPAILRHAEDSALIAFADNTLNSAPSGKAGS